MQLRTKRIAALLIAATVLFTACGGGGSDDAKDGAKKATPATDSDAGGTAGGELVIARGTPTDGWDPDNSITNATYITLPMVLEGAGYYTSDSKRQDGIVESMTYGADGKSVVWKLRAGVKFSDGTPVTAKDLAFSINEAKAAPNYSIFFERIADVQVTDDLTVTTNLSEPDYYLPIATASAFFAIVPDGYGGKARKDFYAKPIGAGPYMIESEVPDEEIVLVRNPNYYRKNEPLVDKITFKVIADENQRLLQYQSGDVDIVEQVPLTQVAQFPKDEVQVLDGTFSQLLVPNNAKAPMNDPKFRKALSLALDRKKIADGIFEGNAEPARTVMPRNVEDAAQGSGNWDMYDVDQAKKLIAETGYKGQKLTIIFDSSRAFGTTTAQAVQQLLAKIGVNATVEGSDSQTVVGKLFDGDFDLGLWINYSVVPSAGDGFVGLAFTKFLFAQDKTTVPSDQFNVFRSTEDKDKRAEAVKTVENYAFDNSVLIPIVYTKNAWASKPDVKGFKPTPFLTYNSRTLSIGK